MEDEAFVRRVAGEILGSGGYRVLQARTAAEAVEAFRAQSNGVQLILADVVLPQTEMVAISLMNGARERYPGHLYLWISGKPH